MKCLTKFEKNKSVKISCIYKITNIKNDKVYIGQTINFRKRLSDYMTAHKKDNSKIQMYNVIKSEGTDNFTIEIIKTCNENELNYYETYYIKKYNACNPNYGYNKMITNSNNSKLSRKRKSLAHNGLKESNKTKRKKSNIIYACKGEKLFICDSGKLFGDYIGVSKDYVKNCLKQPSKLKGWRVYYSSYEKRQEIRKKMYKKRCIKDYGYIDILDNIDTIELNKTNFEGVETIYDYFSDIKYLIYGNESEKYELKPYSEIMFNVKRMDK